MIYREQRSNTSVYPIQLLRKLLKMLRLVKTEGNVCKCKGWKGLRISMLKKNSEPLYYLMPPPVKSAHTDAKEQEGRDKREACALDHSG